MKNALCAGVALLALQTGLLGWQKQDQPVSAPPVPAVNLDSVEKQTAVPTPTSERVLLPKGTPVCLFSTRRMSTKTARLNDKVTFRVAQDISAGDLTLIPKGTEVQGTVTDAGKAGHDPHVAKLSFAFGPLPVGSGQTVPIRVPGKSIESFGQDLKALWQIGGPWLMPLAPFLLSEADDEVLTKSTCVWARTALGINVDKNEVLRRQQAAPAAAPGSDSNPTSARRLTSAETVNLTSSEQDSQTKITEIEVGFGPGDIAFTPGAIWVSWGNSEDRGISRIDANTGKVVGTILAGKTSQARPAGQFEIVPCCASPLAAGEGSLWAGGKDQVFRIDPTTNQVVATIPVANPGPMAVGEGSVWVTQRSRKSVSRIDPQTNQVIATIRLDHEPLSIAAGGGAVWVVELSGISRIDPETNAPGKTIHLRVPPWPSNFQRPVSPEQVLVQGDDVWVTASVETVVRIDARSNKIVACVTVPPRKDFFTVGPITNGLPRGAAILDGYLWVADSANETLWKIDTRTNEVIGAPVLVGFHPQILGPGNDGNGAIWVSNEFDGTVMKVKP